MTDLAPVNVELLREALLRMEHACEQLAATRSHAIYTVMIDGGQAQALLELDNARRAARELLRVHAQTLRKLVWLETFADRGDGSKEQDGWEADSGFGSWYSIEQYFGSDSFGWQVKFEYAVIADHDDPDKAKESAQADFERRALALPSTMPLPAAPQPVAWRWREITSAPDDWHYQAIEPRFINPPHFIVEPLSALTSTEEK